MELREAGPALIFLRGGRGDGRGSQQRVSTAAPTPPASSVDCQSARNSAAFLCLLPFTATACGRWVQLPRVSSQGMEIGRRRRRPRKASHRGPSRGRSQPLTHTAKQRRSTGAHARPLPPLFLSRRWPCWREASPDAKDFCEGRLQKTSELVHWQLRTGTCQAAFCLLVGQGRRCPTTVMTTPAISTELAFVICRL